jgi:hypothetical protein
MIPAQIKDFLLSRNLKRKFYQTNRSQEEDQDRKENQNIEPQTLTIPTWTVTQARVLITD